MASSVTEPSVSHSNLSDVQLPPSTLELPSGRTVFIRLIWRDVQVNETELMTNRIGLIILAEKDSNYQGTHNVTERLEKLAAEGKIKTDSSFQILQSTNPRDVIQFSEILARRHKNMGPENVEIWGDTYNATFLAICLFLFENYNLPGIERCNFETAEDVLGKAKELGVELADIKKEDKERLNQFLQAYLDHLKSTAPQGAIKEPSLRSKIWEAFKRCCCCCCAACFPSKVAPMGNPDYQKIPE